MAETVYRLATTTIGEPNFADAGLAAPPDGTFKMTRDLNSGVCLLVVPAPLEEVGPGAVKPLEGEDIQTVFDAFKEKMDFDLEAVRIQEVEKAQEFVEVVEPSRIQIVEMAPEDLKREVLKK